MKRSLIVWPVAAVVVAVAGFTADSAADPASPVGQPPPEWAANTWPAHNHDLWRVK
jgi:hypothetical protein